MKSRLLLLRLLFLLSSVTLTSTVRALQAPAAPMTVAFGPEQYIRDAGPPDTFTETFQYYGTSPCQIVVVNGNADGTQRISSASISLNGQQIVGRRIFQFHKKGEHVSVRFHPIRIVGSIVGYAVKQDIQVFDSTNCSAGTPVLHRVSRFSTGLNRRYSIPNMTRRNRSVQAKTCAIEKSPNQ